MSYKVKPEDVPPELAKTLLEWTSIVPRQARAKVAEMANQMIEAGLVSPPCRILRSKHGTLVTGAIYIDDDHAQSDASPGDSSEHYMGQTE